MAIRTWIPLSLAMALLSACQTAPVKTAVPSTSPEEVGEFRKGSGYLNGYLDRKDLPDSLALKMVGGHAKRLDRL